MTKKTIHCKNKLFVDILSLNENKCKNGLWNYLEIVKYCVFNWMVLVRVVVIMTYGTKVWNFI